MDYELGLEALKQLAAGREWEKSLANWEARLRANLEFESEYGAGIQTSQERAQFIDKLNALALNHTGITFTDLCLGRKPPGRSKSPLSGRTASVSILFLAADPTDLTRLRLGEEIREIQEKLQLSKLRDQFSLHPRFSVRPADISQALLDVSPRIVHFSGHGTRDGELCFEDVQGTARPVAPGALAALFEQFEDQVQCIVLNACFSEAQASAIALHIPYVIGMNQAIGDRAAIAFAIGFYQALGAGQSIEQAYKLGCAQIGFYNIGEELTPVLIKKG